MKGGSHDDVLYRGAGDFGISVLQRTGRFSGPEASSLNCASCGSVVRGPLDFGLRSLHEITKWFHEIRRVRRRSHFSLTSQKKERTLDRRLAEIRQRVFEIHIECCGTRGCDLDDWLQAERELQEKYKNNEKGTKEN
jgi:hypothetical protein